MLRRAVKSGLASVLHHSGTDRLFGLGAGRGRTPLVLGYHRVVEDFDEGAGRTIPSMLISAQMLARHLDWLGHRYEFVTLDDLTAWARGEKQFRRPVAAVTFDDGYRDVYEHGFPLLKAKGIPAAVFVTTDLVDTPYMQLHDELYLLLLAGFSTWRTPRQRLAGLLCGLDCSVSLPPGNGVPAIQAYRVMRAFLESLGQTKARRIVEALRSEIELPPNLIAEHGSLTWEMLEKMQSAGVTVGSHTRTHPFLTNEPGDRVLEEIGGSRREAERRLGTEIRHFAYPDGRFDTAVVEAVAAAGYRSAYTTCRHRDSGRPELTIPRRILWEKSCVNGGGRFSPSIMSCQVNGVFDGANRCDQVHGERINGGAR